MTDYQLRAARPQDLPAIVGLIGELADFEHLTHLVKVTPDSLEPHLFGDRPVAECQVAELTQAAGEAGDAVGQVVAFALHFTNFSTFLGKPGLYLEDLYVQPAYRGRGIGKALLQRLASLAVERGCGRFEWSVLDWNEHAIRFYRSMGAHVHAEWQLCRVTGDALTRLGTPGP